MKTKIAIWLLALALPLAAAPTSALTPLTTPDPADFYNIVDASDTTMSVNGTNKKLTLADLVNVSSFTTGNFLAANSVEFAQISGLTAALDSKVANTTTVNGQALSADVTVTTVTGNAGTATALSAGADRTKLDAITGANTGNDAVNSLYSGLVSNATHTGEVTGATGLTITAGAVTLAKMADMATASLVYRKTAGSGAPEVNTLATLKTDLALVKADVGLGSVDNTADTAKPVSTAQQTALNLKADLASATFTGTPSLPTGATATTQAAADSSTKLATTAFVTTADNLKANLASPTFTGTPTLPTGAIAATQAVGNNSVALATTAFVTAASNYGQYRTILQASGSHIAAQVAGTYALANGNPLAISGTGTLYPIGLIHIVAADYPTVNGLAAKLRIRMQLQCNDVAPTGNYTAGLFPVTRPATSGGAGLAIYTLGTVVSGSNGATIPTPAADSSNLLVGADFALPADGLYCIGIVTTGTVATSAHIHIAAQLQMHNQ